MSQKLKIILGGLILIAGFLIVRVGSSFYGSARTAALISRVVVTPTPEENPLTKDGDGDGLSDRDEIIYGTDPFDKDTDGDGYIDGEEIVSGYDPLDPFDNPKTRTSGNNQVAFVPPSANLTDRLLNLGLANLLDNSGTLNPDQMTTGKFADILSSVENEAISYLSVPPLTDSEIKITDDNSPSRITKYLKTVTPILEESIFSSVGGVSGLDQGIGTAEKNSDHYKNVAASLKIIEAPSSWKEIHKGAIRNFQQLANSFSAMTDQAVETDPIKSSFALNEIQDAFLQLFNLLSQASQLAKAQNVPTGDSIIDTLQSANSAPIK
jgi:hypothetical protein